MRRIITIALGFAVIAGILFIWAPGRADAREIKIGYINSQKILAEYQESVAAQRTLDEEQQKWVEEARKKEQELKRLEDELENQSLLLSEEKKAEKLQDIQTKYMEYQRFQQEIWGETGKLYQRNKELTQPIVDKVNAIITKIGKDNDYDLIFDAAVGNIVYAKDDYDVTELVLENLNK
jgi:outer membrane protein